MFERDADILYDFLLVYRTFFNEPNKDEFDTDELLNIVSENDKVIGQEKRSVLYAQKSTCFRVINGFIYNQEKKLWIPRRHQDKKRFPLHLDASVGGHVRTGETYEEAFIRETYEELGLKPSTYTYKAIARLTPAGHNTSAFMGVYLIHFNEVPTYNKEDFIEFYWLSREEVLEKLASGDKAKGDLALILQEISKNL